MRFTAALLALVPAAAQAAGFQVYEQGAAATGMVGAFTALADDASAIFYNPAGLADQQGWQVYIGGTLITGKPEATGSSFESSVDRSWNPLPTMYASYGWDGKYAAGVGVFTQFGLATDWPDDWPGRFVVTRSFLETVTINPSVAWRVTPWLSIGGGVSITPAKVRLKRQLDLVSEEAEAEFVGNAVGFGANIGALVNVDRFSFGVHWRSGYDLDFDDAALRIDAPPALSAMLHDVDASATVPTPDVVSFGAGAQIDKVFVQAQLDWVNWSEFKVLTLDAPDAPQMEMSIPQNWDDGWTLRLAAELHQAEWHVRAGTGYDWNPVPADTLSPTIPDANRFFASVGVSYDFLPEMTIDLAVMGVFFADRTSDLPELPLSYQNFGLLTALAGRYRF